MALAVVLISALADVPIRKDVAMTGEITLRGRILPIGGLKEKAIAAYKSGVKTVLIPKENERDLIDVDDKVRETLIFIPCSHANEAIKEALLFPVFNKKDSATKAPIINGKKLSSTRREAK